MMRGKTWPLVIVVLSMMMVSAMGGALAHRSERLRGMLRDIASEAGIIEANNGNHDPYADVFDANNPALPGVRSLNDPDFLVRPGFDVEHVATGLTLPVAIAFPHQHGESDDAPWLYVTELHRGISYVTRAGEVHDYSGDALTFLRSPHWRVDEVGFIGLISLPDSEDLILTASYVDEVSGRPKNHILRLVSEPGGRKLARVEVVLDINELTAPGHAIGCAKLGQDGNLYVGVGDGYDWTRSQDLDRWGGKMLRLNLDGSACEDNPFFDPDAPQSSRSYTFAYGLRNPFDHAHHPELGTIYAIDHGPEIDRVIHVLPGANYGWNGDSQSIRINALYVWSMMGNLSPGCVTFMTGDGLGFSARNTLLVAGFGPTGHIRVHYSKNILQFRVVPERGMLAGPPTTLIRYTGATSATVLGLTEGPDGLYFTDFFGRVVPQTLTPPTQPEGVDLQDQFAGKGSIWRVVPSERTVTIPQDTGSPLAVGERLVRTTCSACHTIDGVGSFNGPDLSHTYTRLDQRLNNAAYDLHVAHLLDDVRFELHRERLNAVKAAVGDERIRVWLHHHLEDPTFDHLRAQMPAFNLLPQPQRDAIIDYLMTRK
jgi:glucose/arabinose dehydrogenase/mono/diheme cytochrome c family protein